MKATFTSKNLKSLLIERILKPYMIQNGLKNMLLIQDQAPPHVEPSFLNQLRLAGISVKPIPKLMTSLLQMADVCWLSCMKRCIK